jgi:predicted PurR-regulated permease PerM
MTLRTRALAWVGVFVVFLIVVSVLRQILFPFIAGFAIAYFLDPVCDRLERMGMSRTWATVAVTAVFFVLFILALALLVPLLYSQIVQFLENLPRYAAAIEGKAAPLIEALRGYLESGETKLKVRQFLQANLGDVARIVLRFLGNLVGGLELTFNLISLFVITPIVAFYMLRDWDLIVAKIDGWLPRDNADTIREQVGLMDEMLSAFVRGQGTVCLLLGAFYGIGLTLVGLDFGLLIGLFTGLVSFVPYFGMLIGFVLGVALAFAQFDSYVPIAMVAGVFIAGQVIEGNFVTPKIVGDRVNLHAVWIMFALLAGAALFGFVGILLAIPAAAVIGVLVRFGLAQYRDSRMFLGDGGGKTATDADTAS